MRERESWIERAGERELEEEKDRLGAGEGEESAAKGESAEENKKDRERAVGERESTGEIARGRE